MKQLLIALRVFLALTVVTGLLYPAVITLLAKAIFPHQANGSLVVDKSGKLIGSELIAQSFKSERYFWPRPSGVDFNPLPSGGTNLGPTSKALQEKWAERRKAGLSEDLLAASGSGLDPHISPLSAEAQLARVATARKQSAAEIKQIVASTTEGRQLGFLGESRVNILKLNMLLDERFP